MVTDSLAFIVLTFFHMFGVFVYAALWLVMPPAAREESLLEVFLGRLQTAARKLRGGGAGQDDAATAPPPARIFQRPVCSVHSGSRGWERHQPGRDVRPR